MLSSPLLTLVSHSLTFLFLHSGLASFRASSLALLFSLSFCGNMLLIEWVNYHQTELAALTSLISTVFQLMTRHFSLSSLHVCSCQPLLLSFSQSLQSGIPLFSSLSCQSLLPSFSQSLQSSVTLFSSLSCQSLLPSCSHSFQSGVSLFSTSLCSACQTGETERCSPEEIGSWDCWMILHSLKDLVSPSGSSYPYKCGELPMAYTSPDLCKHEVNWEVSNHELEHCRNQRCECSKLSLVIIDSLYQ